MWKTSSFCNVESCVEVGFWDISSFCANGECIEAGSFTVSSFSGVDNCVEVGAVAHSSFSNLNGACLEAEGVVRSSFSAANGHCVEAAHEGHFVAVRDTKDLSLTPALFHLDAWKRFIDNVKAGKYPVCADVDEYPLAHLVFNRNEWDAFVRGARNLDENGRGEFDLGPELEEELALAEARALA